MEWSKLLGFTVIGALVTTTGTLLGLFLKEVLLARSFEQWKTKQSLAQVSRKYQEPIALAAIELSTRLTRICQSYPADFMDSALLKSIPARPSSNSIADPHYRRYTLISTVYRLCAFLGWVELYRQETTYLDTTGGSNERRVDRAIFAVRSDLADGQLNKAQDREHWHDALLFREEQRAIGESMIVSTGESRTVMGYAEFCDLFLGKSETSRAEWLRKAGVFLFDQKARKDFRKIRMQRLIVHLVELVDILSPARLRDEHWGAHAEHKEVAENLAT
jgi:hypothetical protein